MATNTLIIKDGNGALSGLSAFSGSKGLIPEHVISGTVNVSSSATNPVYVTGTVQISQPVNVDIVVGDNISVTSSLAAPLYISSSVNSPVLVTGTVTVTASHINPAYINGVVSVSSISSNVNVVVDADKYAYPGSTLGALVTKITASDVSPIFVTSSQVRPIYVTGGVVFTDSEVHNFQNTALWITNSLSNPIYISSSIGRELFIANTQVTAIHTTSSNANPVVTKNVIATTPIRNSFSSFAGTINWAGTGSSNISGTFILAQDSSARKGLMFANSTNKDLYIALGDTDFSSTNGFLLTSTASAPSYYSFIIYPSGTYFAEQVFVNIKHSGFFVSSSNIDVKISSITTE